MTLLDSRKSSDVEKMDPNMSMPSGNSAIPLDPSNFNLSNDSQAMDFLSQLLDDTTLQYDAQNFSRYFWYCIVVVIGLFAIDNAFRNIDSTLRIRTARSRMPDSPPPATYFRQLSTTVSNIGQALTLPQVTPPKAKFWIRVPPLGTVILIAAYLTLIVALEFIKNDVPGAQYWTSLGIRAGWLAITQLPLLILLSAKNNLIGLVLGLSYERLNGLHRWVARCMLLMAIMHFAFQDHAWIKYGVRSLEWSTDQCVPTGFATFGLLIWMNVSTVLPLRNWWYEFFVVQHLFTFFGFIIAIMYHLPDTALETRVYIWVSIGLYLFDRILRAGRSVWNSSCSVQATVVSIGDVSRIEVQGSRLRTWSPGSFVLLSVPHFGPLQSHPATVMSTPISHDGTLVFLLKARNGFTKKLLPGLMPSKFENGKSEAPKTYRAFVDGSYGGRQSDFAAFDTVLLIAGSTGITFIMSILLDLSSRATRETLLIRRLQIIWAVRNRAQLALVANELQAALQRIEIAGIEVKLAIHITRDGCDGQAQIEAKIPENHEATANVIYSNIEFCRPVADTIISELLSVSTGGVGIAFCGPLSWSSEVRRIVATKSLTSKSRLYLHVEGFSW